MRHKLEQLLPSYSRLPLIMVVVCNFTVYNGCRLLTSGRHHYSLYTRLDEAIPFLPCFASIYVLAFLQWIIGFILIAREGKDFCWRVFSSELIAKLLCGLCFLLLPTTIDRPAVTGASVWDALIAFIYRVDAADNLFPSIHCLESWICLRTALCMKRTPRWYIPVSLVLTLLVFASTVLLKQHVVWDIAGGVAAAELGFALSKILGAQRLFGLFSRPDKA